MYSSASGINSECSKDVFRQLFVSPHQGIKATTKIRLKRQLIRNYLKTYSAIGFVRGNFSSSVGGAGGRRGKCGVTAVNVAAVSRAESRAGERGSSTIILIDTSWRMNQI